MEFTLEIIIFYLLLIDSLGANLMAWFGSDRWYKRNLGFISKYFPITKGWAGAYLVLVLWIGYLSF